MKSNFTRLLLIMPIALILTIVPIPEILTPFRPSWICLLVLYIQFYLPRYFNLMLVVILGLCLDVLLSTVLGEHGFALLFICWIANAKVRRFCFFSMSQQMTLVGFLCLTYQCTILLMDAFLGFEYIVWKPLSVGVLGLLLWPWIRLLMDDQFLTRLKKY